MSSRDLARRDSEEEGRTGTAGRDLSLKRVRRGEVERMERGSDDRLGYLWSRERARSELEGGKGGEERGSRAHPSPLEDPPASSCRHSTRPKENPWESAQGLLLLLELPSISLMRDSRGIWRRSSRIQPSPSDTPSTSKHTSRAPLRRSKPSLDRKDLLLRKMVDDVMVKAEMEEGGSLTARRLKAKGDLLLLLLVMMVVPVLLEAVTAWKFERGSREKLRWEVRRVRKVGSRSRVRKPW